MCLYVYTITKKIKLGKYTGAYGWGRGNLGRFSIATLGISASFKLFKWEVISCLTQESKI